MHKQIELWASILLIQLALGLVTCQTTCDVHSSLAMCNLKPHLTLAREVLSYSFISANEKKSESSLLTVDLKSFDLQFAQSVNESAKWASVCPALCTNQCDTTGVCALRVKLVDSERNAQILTVEMRDNLKELLSAPAFPQQLYNVSVDWDMERANEIVLIESTQSIDAWRSKPNRIKNKFELEMIRLTANQSNDAGEAEDDFLTALRDECKSRLINDELLTNPFEVRFDSQSEKLSIRLRNDSANLRHQSCFLFKLFVWRAAIDTERSHTYVVLRLNDNRYERPVFEMAEYTFVVDENSPMDTVIGQVNALYLNAQEGEYITYRIVPFVSTAFYADSTAESDEVYLSTLPVRINQSTGLLTQKLNIDREKNIDKSEESNGIIRFSIEASYASILYSYCKVKIVIRDVNDNAPVAHIRSTFGKSTNEAITNLYVNENTPINQILAYVAINDADLMENGTVKSIDLSVLSVKKTSLLKSKQRQYKLALFEQHHMSIDKRILAKPLNVMSNKASQIALPIKLNKIGDKLYTIQLASKLDYTQVEAFSIEMRIQDNGTRPQLESVSRINLNVVDLNDHAPQFLPTTTQIELVESVYAKGQTIVNASVNTEWPIIFKVNAVDLDDDRNGQVKYSLVNNPFSKLVASEEQAKYLLDSTFSLNKETGEVKLLRGINRDELNFGEDSEESESLELIVMAQDQSVLHRLNSTIKLRIRLVDLNNNKPVLSLRESLTRVVFFNRTQAKFKQLAESIYIKDADSADTNSKQFAFKSSNLNEKFIFNDELCFKTLNMQILNALNADSVFFLMEKVDKRTCKMTIYSDLTKLSNESQIEFDLQVNDYGLNNQSFNNESTPLHFLFKLIAGEEFTKSITLKRAELGTQTLINFEDRMQLIQISQVNEMKQDDVNSEKQFVLRNLTKSGEFALNSNRTGLLLNENLGNGVYLIELNIYQNEFGLMSFEKVPVLIYDEHERDLFIKQKLLRHYEQFEEKRLEQMFAEEKQFNTIQMENGLFGNAILASQEHANAAHTFMNTFWFNNRSSFVQILIVSFVLSMFLVTLLIICLILVIKRNCTKRNERNEKKALAKSIFSSHHVINVINDDEKRFDQQPQMQVENDNYLTYNIQKQESSEQSKEKVSRYLSQLEPVKIYSITEHGKEIRANQQDIATSPSSSTTQSSSVKNLITNSQQNKTRDEEKKYSCHYSTTSSSCLSDEGCYGSSDFSSDKEIKQSKCAKETSKLAAEQLVLINSNMHMLKASFTQSNQATPRTQTFYTSGSAVHQQQQQQQHQYCLSRFEKIYNSRNELDFSNIVESSVQAAYFFPNDETPGAIAGSTTSPSDDQLVSITAIAGSYV